MCKRTKYPPPELCNFNKSLTKTLEVVKTEGLSH